MNLIGFELRIIKQQQRFSPSSLCNQQMIFLSKFPAIENVSNVRENKEVQILKIRLKNRNHDIEKSLCKHRLDGFY